MSPEEQPTQPASWSVEGEGGNAPPPPVGSETPSTGASAGVAIAGEARVSIGRDVLDRARRRDPEALEAFFDATIEAVYALAYRLLGDRSAAEDVTQDVFVKIHGAVERLDSERDPWPWIATITHNACRDVWRSGAFKMARRSESIDGAPAVADRLPGGSPDPEVLVLANERERLVREAIQRLPEHLREAVLLYDYRGLSHLEVASIIGIEHAAARKRYSRALEMLGKLLNETLGR